MTVIVTIAIYYGLPGPERYIDEICRILKVNENDVVEFLHYQIMHSYFLRNVDSDVYFSNDDNIYNIFKNYHDKGYIRYFYMGEGPESCSGTGKLEYTQEQYY